MTLTSMESPESQYLQHDRMLLDEMERRILRLAQKNHTLLGTLKRNTETLELVREAVTCHKNRMRQLWKQLGEIQNRRKG
ncbi:hypothetical protein ACP26L_02705 [Paenibacillus sp. S-38]|uniref:hypothetical protein n=1 Tax=Paenibacillus sp. S-38 TaxID=3416710 RepID=UPI003CE6BADA